MGNSLKHLQPTDQPADVQRTTLSADILGRYVCNSLQEALDSADGSLRPDARPFDLIVIGGGTFGAALAEHLWYRDAQHAHRVLVLEAGPFAIPEHVQNLPMLGLNVPTATTPAQLRALPSDKAAAWANVMWGVSWNSNVPFPGLAYGLGGRSLFWGGWSPQPLDQELPIARWPANLVADLKGRYFEEARVQIGTNESNDFIFGPLHAALRQSLFDAIDANKAGEAIPLDELDLHLDGVPPAEQEIAKLEAPLAVQGRAPRAGYFPLNKFSSVPLLVKAARASQAESSGDDVRRRLMVVPNCHVQRLVTEATPLGLRVVGIQTSERYISLAPSAKVFIALGTIESARLALLSFTSLPPAAYQHLGKNLMAHLRSNLTIRIPRASLPNHASLPNELAASALFMKCRHVFAGGPGEGYYHIQITACGLGAMGSNSEAEMWQTVPDIDTFQAFEHANDDHVVITLRGIGEMQPENPESHVSLDMDPAQVDWNERRAYTMLAKPYEPAPGESMQTRRDRELWAAMDDTSDRLAVALAKGQPFEVLTPRGFKRVTNLAEVQAALPYTYKNHPQNPGRRDGMGTTHHEAGTLRMGADPSSSVTDADGRFHGIENAYAVGPALFPTVGSPNPMLTGIALARRTGDRLLTASNASVIEPGFQSLFDGTRASFLRWQTAGLGQFSLIDGAIVAYPSGDGLGLLWHPKFRFGDFVLRLEFSLDSLDANSGIFVRFRDPREPVPDRANPALLHRYGNPAWVAVTTGFEVQIDELARPDGADMHRTGAIYGVPVGLTAGQQSYRRPAALEARRWYECEVEVRSQTYEVRLAGQPVTSFVNGDADRGPGPDDDAQSGYVGLQAHSGLVRFRNVRVRDLAATSGGPPTAQPAETVPAGPREKPRGRR